MSVSIFGPTGNCRKLHSKNKMFEEDFCCHCDRLKNSSERQIKRTYGTAGKVPCKRASGSVSPPPPPSPSLTTQRANNRYDDQNRGSLSEAWLAKRVNSCDPLGFVAGPAGGAKMFKDTTKRRSSKTAVPQDPTGNGPLNDSTLANSSAANGSGATPPVENTKAVGSGSAASPSIGADAATKDNGGAASTSKRRRRAVDEDQGDGVDSAAPDELHKIISDRSNIDRRNASAVAP